MNKKTLIGAGIGLMLGVLAAPFVFGIVFGVLFFFANAILFGLKIIQNGPIFEPFFYMGFAAAIITPIASTIIGGYSGKKTSE